MSSRVSGRHQVGPCPHVLTVQSILVLARELKPTRDWHYGISTPATHSATLQRSLFARGARIDVILNPGDAVGSNMTAGAPAVFSMARMKQKARSSWPMCSLPERG